MEEVASIGDGEAADRVVSPIHPEPLKDPHRGHSNRRLDSFRRKLEGMLPELRERLSPVDTRDDEPVVTSDPRPPGVRCSPVHEMLIIVRPARQGPPVA